jgi:hypothetical protein
MGLRVLMVGDVFGEPGRRALERLLPGLRERLQADVVVANGENSAGGLGITGKTARQLWGAGVDVITTGNHVWRQRDAVQLLNDEERILRPLNYPPGAPGRGSVRLNVAGHPLTVVNLQGRVFMAELDCPFRALDAELAAPGGGPVVVDMHAEATSEKLALAWHADGRAAAVCGTHTHVLTADDKLLPGGTAYITDLGLTGPHRSVIGMDPKSAANRFLSGRPLKFKVAKAEPRLQGALVELDPATGLAAAITRVDEAA